MVPPPGVPPVVAPSRIFVLTNLPEAVNAESGQPPEVLAPGTSAEAVSFLSNKDQLAELSLCWFMKLIQV